MVTENRVSRCEDEHNQMMKIINFRFPHKFKIIGLVCAGLIFGFLLLFKFYGSNDLLIKDISRTVVLLFLLLASLSKDTIEDEYINHIRSQSYILAFIFATAYSIGLPLIAFLMDVLINKVTAENTINFHEVSAFEVLFMLICFQLLFFETFKRLGRAK